MMHLRPNPYDLDADDDLHLQRRINDTLGSQLDRQR